MVYKKYIKRDGKLYGPYLYKSIKKDGKVITEYLGTGKDFKVVNKKDASNKFFVFTGILSVLILIIFFVFFLNTSITGKVSLQIDDNYKIGEQINGKVKLNLKNGELLPADTKIIIDNSGTKSEYLLSDLISAGTSEGNFYIENKEITGSGLGYGTKGEKITYPYVDFTLKISETAKEEKEKQEQPQQTTETTEEQEQQTETTTSETTQEQTSTTEETPIETQDSEAKEKTEKETKKQGEQQTTEETTEQQTQEQFEQQETTTSPESIGITGEAVSESSIEIKDKVSKSNPYTYTLIEGQTAEIISSSHDVKLKIKDNTAEITTDYEEIEQDFGKDYLTNSVNELNIDLTSLGLTAQEGELKVSLVYNEQELVSASKTISVSEEKPKEEKDKTQEKLKEIKEEEIIEENITETNITIVNKTIENITIVNETIIKTTIGNISINTIQYNAVINKPVKWKKNIQLDNIGEIKIEIPKEATNISVYILGETTEEINETASSVNAATQTEQSNASVNEQSNTTFEQQNKMNSEQKQAETKKEKISDDKVKITAKVISAEVISGKISAEIELEKEKSVVINFFKKIFNKITGKVIDIQENQEIKEVTINENATEFEIEYETPAPISTEKNISNGKEITISSEMHYENILAFTELPREIPVNSISSIKLYHIVNNTKQRINTVNYDTNNNSLIDYIEWLVPSLSNQTYQLIIEITKAEHLDSSRTFISDIYNEVKALDGIWSETINNNEYVRVTFELPLDNTRDITLYPRVVNGTPKIEVYEKNGNELIAEFSTLQDNQYNKVYLTNLTECYDNETEILTDEGWKYFSELDKTEKVATLNPETHETEFHKPYRYQTYEHNSEMYKIILEDSSELLVSPEHKVYAGTHLNKLLGYEINLNGEITNNLPLKSENSILLNNLDNSENVVSINGGLTLSMIIPEYSFGGNNLLLRKCLSNVNMTLDSDLAILDNCLSVNPDETFLISCPSFINKSSTAFGKFSSERNLSLFLEENMFFFSDEFRSICHNREDSRFCKLRKIVFENVFNTDSCSEQFHNLPNHDSSSFESGCPTANLTINDNMLVNLDSHKHEYTNKLYKSFSLQPIIDVYSEFNNNKEIYFLDLENKPIKISSITKEPYNGKIYDVSVDNHIILVKRHNSSAIWSGNSHTQDVFDLKIVDGSVEIEHIVDPATNPYVVLNAPANNTFTNLNWVLLNATIYNNVSATTNMTVYIYANNNSNGLNASEGLVYKGLNIANNTQIIYNLTALPIKPGDLNLVLLYHFDNMSEFGESYNNSNGSIIYDFSSAGSNGTLYTGANGDTVYNVSGGKFAGAFQFDGVNDRIYRNITADGKNWSGNFTVSVWVKAAKTGQANLAGIFSSSDSSAYNTFQIDIQSGCGYSVRVNDDSGNSYTICFDTTYDTNWHHLVLVRNSSSALLTYQDGVFKNSLNLGISGFNGLFNVYKIGANRGYTAFFNGTIDEVAVWNRTLSANEILDIYRLGKGKYYWNVNASDGTLSNLSETREFTIDTTLPTITLNYPANASTQTNPINFNWTASDNLATTLTCNLTIDSVVNASNILSNNGTATNKTITGFSEIGSHLWNVTCWDNATNTNTSVTRTFTIDNTPPGINFTTPTSLNNSFINKNYTEINVSITNALDLNEIKFNWNSTNYTIYDNSLLLFLNFDNRSALGENDTFVNDLSKYNNNGSVYGGNNISWTNNGKYGGAFNFSGKIEYIINSTAFSGSSNNNRTLSVWVKASMTGQVEGSGIFTTSGTGANTLQLDIGGTGFGCDGKYRIRATPGTGAERTVCFDTYDTNWHHLVMTFASNNSATNNISTYMDGVYKNSDVANTGWSVDRYKIGTNRGNIAFFNGTIDEVAVWNRTLTDSEIQQLYYSSLTKYDSQNWSLYVNQSNLANGNTYTYQAFAKDTIGNENQTEVRQLTVDTIAPYNITLNSPANNSVQTNPVNFNWTASDNLATTLTCNLTIDSVVNASNILSNNGTATNKTVTGFASGSHLWNVTCWDNATNTNISATFSFTISSADSIPPNITIISPLNQTYNTATILFNITSLDDTGMSACLYTLTNGVTNYTMSNSTSSVWNATNSTMAQGSHTAGFYCNDTTNNLNNSETKTFVVDTIFPQINITYPQNTTYNINVSALNYTYSDTNTGVCWYSTNNGATNSSTQTPSANFTNVISSEGSNTWNLYCNDTANNLNTTSITFFKDTIYPLIDYGTGTSNSSTYYSRNWIFVNVSLTETNFKNITFYLFNITGLVNSTSYTTQTFSINFTSLIDGNYSINATIYDTLENKNTTSTRNNIILDTINPTINFTSPTETNNSYIGRNNTLVNVTSTDANLANITINLYNSTSLVNSTTTSSSPNFVNITNLIEGVYYFNSTSIDLANNINTTETRIITLDSTYPVVTLISPANAYSSTDTSVSFSYNVTDTSSTNCSLILDGAIINFNSSVNISGGTNTFTNTTSVASHTWNINCTDSMNNIMNSSSRTFTITSAPSSSSTSSGGGGGGVTLNKTEQAIDFNLDKESYESTMVLGRLKNDSITITNNEKTEKTFKIEVLAIDDIISFDNESIKIASGETKSVKFRISAPEKTGIYTGKIIVSSGTTKKEILITINVKTEKSLFDITLTIPKFMKVINIGETFYIQLDLLQMGLKEKADVTLNYIIKDFNGNVYLTESETIAVTDQKTLRKEFETKDLPPGDYVIGTELVYAEGVAVSSSQFKIKQKLSMEKEQIVMISLILFIVFVAVIILLAIKRYKKLQTQLIK